MSWTDVDFPNGSPATIVSTTTVVDDNGDSTTETVEVEWGLCALAPRYANESVDPRTAPVVVGSMIYGPPLPTGVTIDSDDRISLGGAEWQVDGLPEDYTGLGRNPFTGWEPGLAVPVKRAGVV